jgi:hypothetical protein
MMELKINEGATKFAKESVEITDIYMSQQQGAKERTVLDIETIV